MEVIEGEVIEAERPTLPVIFHDSPFASAVTRGVATEGQTVAEIVEKAKGSLPREYLPFLRVWIDDLEIEQAQWTEVRPLPGQTLYVRVVPGKSGKDIFRTIAAIAIIVAVAYFAPQLTPQVASALGVTSAAGVAAVGAFVSTSLTMIGFLALNALVPPPGLKNQGQDDQRFQLTGTSNAYQPYANIPRVIGKRRLFPMLAARPYSELQGDDEYLRILLCVGWGPLKIENIKIGETPISAFSGVEIETREGWLNDTPLTLFTRSVNEQSFQQGLEPSGMTGYYNFGAPGLQTDLYFYDYDTSTYTALAPSAASYTNGYATRTTSTNTSEFSIDLTFPAGLYKFDKKGNRVNATVQFSVQYRQVGSPTWINAVWANDFEQGFGTPGQITATSNDNSAVRRSGRVKVAAPGQYEVRVRRDTAEAGDKVVDLSYWTALRSIRNEYPVNQTGLALIAIRIKASNQLNGVPQTINCEATSYLPVWDGANWAFQLSRNPAWGYVDLLRRRAGQPYVADSRIDLPTIKAWADACDAVAPNASEPRWTFDAVLEGGSIFENQRLIASNARALVTMKDGKHSVVRDIPQSVPVQHITPRNSWGYTGTKVFVEYPHALRVNFVNAAKGYETDEVIVYDDGYNAGNATIFDTMDLIGCTSASQAFREARYYMAVAKLRPEEHSVQMDIENLRCTIGDLVRFSHDAIAIGLQWTRVRSRVVDGLNRVTSITLDDSLYFETGKSYVIRARESDGTSVLLSINNPGTGFAATITPTTPPLAADAPAPGDLVLFGEAALESAAMIVKRIEPGEDLTATLYLVDAAPGVHTADTGVIPPFNSLISFAQPQSLPPPKVYFSSVRSDDGAAVINADGSLTYQIVATVQQPKSGVERADYFEVRWKPTVADVPWNLITMERGQSSVAFGPVQVGVSYSMQARGITASGLAGEWGTVVTHVADGRLSIPDLATGLAATPLPGGIRLTWVNPEDYDLWRTEVYENTVNNSGTATLIGLAEGDRFERSGLSGADGARFYWIRSVNTTGLKSALVGPASATAQNRALVLNLNNEAVALPASSAGVVASFAEAIGQVTVFDGPTDVTAAATLSAVASSGLTGTVNTATGTPVAAQPKGYYRVTALTQNTGTLTITATYNGQSVSKVFSVSKALAGTNGTSGTSAVDVNLTRNALQVVAFADGSVASWAGIDGLLTTVQGGTDVTSGATLSASASAGLTGTINTATNTPVNGQPKGYYRVTAMTTDTGTLTLTAVVGGVTYTRTVTVSKVKGGYEIVGALPGTNLFEGRVVYLTTDDKLYRYTGSAWTAGVPTVDLTGQIASGQIADAAVVASKIDAVFGGGNLLSNPDFEQGMTGWSPYSSGGAYTDGSAFAGIGRDGSAGYRISWNTNTGVKGVLSLGSPFFPGFRQDRWYTLSFYARAAGAALGQVMFLGWNFGPSVSEAVSNPALTGAYQRYVFRVRWNSPTTADPQLFISINPGAANGTSQLDIDDVQVEEGQIPSAFAPALRPGNVTSTVIADGAISTPKIAANAVAADKIAANAVTADKVAANAITAGKIAALAVTTDKLLISAPGAALNADPNFRDASAWLDYGGAGMPLFVTVTDGPRGNTAIRSSAAGSGNWINEQKRIPIDPTKQYRVRSFARTVSGAGSLFYMGVALFDANGANITGDGSQWYYAASAVQPPASWQEYVASFGAGTARTFPANARFMVPLVILSLSGGTSVQECQDVRIEEVLPGTLIQDGAITTRKLLVGDFSVLNRNNGFEEGDAVWVKGGGWSIDNVPGEARTGGWRARCSTTAPSALRGNLLPALPGDAFYCEAWLRHSGASGTGSYVRITGENSAGAEIWTANGNTVAPAVGSYTLSSGTFIVPANVVAVRVEVVSALTAGLTLADDIRMIRASNSVQIADGAVLASKVAANAVTADKIEAGAVTAAKINVTDLSAISANVGTLTAGLIRNAADSFRIDVTNGRTVVQVGSFMKVTGAPFGSSGQFLEWYGPFFANLASCTEANATYYLKTNGQAYFGGTLSAGVLRNSAQTTNTDAAAEVLVGSFSTNGNTKTIVVSYNYFRSYQCNTNTGAITGTTSITVVIERSLSGGAWVQIGTLNPTEQQRLVVVDGEPGVPDQVSYAAGGSTTITDNSGATTDMRLRARITTRNLPSFGGASIVNQVITQNISLVSTE